MMTWLTITPLILYLIYHSLNVFTDIKYRLTKNFWHLSFLILGLVYYYVFAFSNSWYHPLISIMIVLLLGLFLERMRLSSPGDTKMFIVTALLLSMMLPNLSSFRIGMAVVIFHLFLISLFTYFKLFQSIGVINTFKNQLNDLKALIMPGVPVSKIKVFDHFPGAVTIMLGGLLFFISINVLKTMGIGY